MAYLAAGPTQHSFSRFVGALLLAAASVFLTAASVQARCGDLPSDLDDIAVVREKLVRSCPCKLAESRADYSHCVVGVVDQAIRLGDLRPECKSTVRRCTSKSTCGRPGAVTCCRTNSRGTTRCAIKRDAARCTAPRGGSACTSDYTSCCDACGPAGCLYRPTPTPAPTPTVPAFCVPAGGGGSLGTVPFATGQGSTDCSSDPPAPPISGHVEDGSGNIVKELGAGCLYTGGLEGSAIPDGGVAKLSATGINGLTVTLGPNAGTGSFDCTVGAGPETACVNGAPGLDGNGTCIDDTDCGFPVRGVCGPRANCYFGPPVPIGGLAPACTINSFYAPLCGSVDLASSEVTMATALNAAVFLTGNGAAPCPQCLAGVCSAGSNEGQPCTPVGSAMTSVDCPPRPDQYLAKIRVVFTELTTGDSEIADAAGLFCPGQTIVGAFAHPEARRIVENGAGLGSGGLENPYQTTLVGVFCIPSTGSGVIDFAGSFPAPGAFSSIGEIDLSGVIGLPPLP